MNNIVFYQKRNGIIFIRPRKSVIGLEIGKETSMGWKVLNIHYLYEGNYYTYLDYRKAVRGKQIKHRQRKRFIKFMIKQLNKLV